MIWKRARKKPVVVKFREVEPNHEIEYGSYKDGYKKKPVERIETLEGALLAFPGKHFVIRGVRGEIYPIEKEIFYETYEVIE